MDIVTNASSVWRRVVRAVDCDVVAHPLCGFQNERDQVRLRIVILPDRAVQRSTGSIEVAQSHIRETVGIRKIAHHMLYDELCASIDIGRIMREIFFNRRFFGFAVYRGRGREYDLGDACFLHAKKQVERPFDVICIILGRIHHGFSDK